MRNLPAFGLVVPLGFPLRIDDNAVITVHVHSPLLAQLDAEAFRSAQLGPPDELTRARAVDCHNLMVQTRLSRGAVIIDAGVVPRAPGGKISGLPAHHAVDGLVIFGPTR